MITHVCLAPPLISTTPPITAGLLGKLFWLLVPSPSCPKPAEGQCERGSDTPPRSVLSLSLGPLSLSPSPSLTPPSLIHTHTSESPQECTT